MRTLLNGWPKWLISAAAAAMAVAVVVDLVQSGQKGRPPAANDFTVKTYHGENWKLSDHLGKRPVLLSFFATWCSPCRMEYPHLLELQKKHAASGVQMLMLTQESPAEIKAEEALDKSPLTIVTGASEVFKSYSVNGIPRTILYDATGNLVKDIEGFDESGVQELDELLSAR